MGSVGKAEEWSGEGSSSGIVTCDRSLEGDGVSGGAGGRCEAGDAGDVRAGLEKSCCGSGGSAGGPSP